MSTIFSKAFFKGIGFYSLLSLLIVSYVGGYYFLSKFFIFHINNYIKSRIGDDPLLVKNFYIISLIVKFIIFFLLLKIIVRAVYNYIFIEEDNDCDLYNKTDFFAGIVSVTFFVIYEFIMFPLYFVDGLDKLLEFIITDIKKYAGVNDSTKKILDIIKSDIHTLTKKDIEAILYDFYTDEYNIITKNPGPLDYAIETIESIIFLMIPEKYHIKSDNKDVFVIANKLGSMVAGNLIVYLIILFCILISVYKYVGSGFLAIICYIVIAILCFYFVILTTAQKMMKFSLNASEVMMEKTIKGSRLPALLLKTEEDALTLINDISSLNPITKMFISRVVDSIKKKIGIKDIMKKGDSINEER